MAKPTKEQTAAREACERLLRNASKRRGGSTIVFEFAGSNDGALGRTYYYVVREAYTYQGKPYVGMNWSMLLARAFGFRINRKREAIAIRSGDAHDIAYNISWAYGKQLHCCAPGMAAGDGWIGPKKGERHGW